MTIALKSTDRPLQHICISKLAGLPLLFLNILGKKTKANR